VNSQDIERQAFEAFWTTPVEDGCSYADVYPSADIAWLAWNARAALSTTPAPVSYYFHRYVDGVKMAEDVEVTRATSIDEAMQTAARLCPKRPLTVLIATPAPVNAGSDREELLADALRNVVDVYGTDSPMWNQARVALDPQPERLGYDTSKPAPVLCANASPSREQPTAEQPSREDDIGPIERDESMDRTYIPLPGGWEVQTQGKGSSFRLCNTESGHRWIVTDEHLHPVLEEMARDIHAAKAPPQQAAQSRESMLFERLTRIADQWLIDWGSEDHQTRELRIVLEDYSLATQEPRNG